MSNPDKLTPEEVRAAFRDLHEQMDALRADLAAIREGLSQAAAAPAAAAQAAGSTVTFEGTSLILSYDDNGEATYKLKGGQYMKFGVRIWPETLPDLKIDPDKLKPGPNQVKLKVVALLGENGPRKVIGLA
jgi:hypothetical protein